MILEVVGTGTDLRLGKDNDEPMMRKGLNNARKTTYDLEGDL